MIQLFLKKIEEKYVFNISQYFWHIFITLATIGCIVGLGYLLWGIIPPSKTDVVKEKYPPITKVTYEELQNSIAPKKSAEKSKTPREVKSAPRTATNDAEFNRVMDSLKMFLPEPEFSWNPTGYYYSPYWFSSERRWIQTSPGLSKILENIFSSLSLSTYPQKTILLRAYNNFLAPIELKERGYGFGALKNISIESMDKVYRGIELLKKAQGLFPKDTDLHMFQLSSFIDNNPVDGFPFVEYATSILPKFSADIRPSILSSMMSSYSYFFNNKLEYQKELTNNYLTFFQNFDDKTKEKALYQYYRLSISKNAERESEVSRIDNKFLTDKASAETEYLINKGRKSVYRLQGVYAVFGSIGIIAIIGILLVLLSIQRYLKNIDIVIASNEAHRNKKQD